MENFGRKESKNGLDPAKKPDKKLFTAWIFFASELKEQNT